MQESTLTIFWVMSKRGNNGSAFRALLIKKCGVDFDDHLKIDKATINFEDQISAVCHSFTDCRSFTDYHQSFSKA